MMNKNESTNMQLVHSFYTKHLDDKSFLIHCICFALSCIYAKRTGFSINLHTDKRGYEYLNMCPYDNIFVDLEEVDLPAKKLFAAVKFKVMEKYPLGTIHIDGDVILKNKVLLDLMKFNDYDVIVQSVEKPPLYGFGWKESASTLDKCKYPDWANRDCNIMYNCGVIGINNPELKKLYFDTYWDMYDQYCENGIIKPSVPDLVIEQQFLYDICESKKYKVKCLIDGDHPSKSANPIGYQHLIGEAKIKEYFEIIKKIKELDKYIYIKLKSKFYGKFRSIWC